MEIKIKNLKDIPVNEKLLSFEAINWNNKQIKFNLDRLTYGKIFGLGFPKEEITMDFIKKNVDFLNHHSKLNLEYPETINQKLSNKYLNYHIDIVTKGIEHKGYKVFTDRHIYIMEQ